MLSIMRNYKFGDVPNKKAFIAQPGERLSSFVQLAGLFARLCVRAALILSSKRTGLNFSRSFIIGKNYSGWCNQTLC